MDRRPDDLRPNDRRPKDHSRTSGVHEQGQYNSQIHQEEDITKDGIGDQMGGNETDTRTSGDHEQGQDNFQLHRDEDNTKDGIGDFKGTGNNLHQAENKAGTRIRTGYQDQDGIGDFQQG